MNTQQVLLASAVALRTQFDQGKVNIVTQAGLMGQPEVEMVLVVYAAAGNLHCHVNTAAWQVDC